jgi:ubiquinone biosynthesis protein UbiJ
MNNPSLQVKFLLITLEKSLNAALQVDTAARQQLANLQRQCIKITIADWNHEVYLLLQDGAIELLEYYEAEPDCDLQCSLKALFKLMSIDANGEVQINPDVIISGNSDLLFKLHEVIALAEPDYEAALARWTGPLVAHQIGRTIRSGASWLGETFKSVTDDLQLYIHEESRLFPHPIEAESLYADISRLAEEVETLAETIEKIKSRSSASNKSIQTDIKRGS